MAGGLRIPVASAIRLLTVVLALVLGLGVIGPRVGATLAVEGTALCDCVLQAAVSDHDVPTLPPPRLDKTAAAEGESDGEDDNEQSGVAELDPALLEIERARTRQVEDEAQPLLAWRLRDGWGARGPPRA